MSKKVAKMGVFVALAMIFSYIEVLIPLSIGIPGAKLGLANLVIVTGLYIFSPLEVLVISFVRIVLSGLLFGNGLSVLYSLAGGMLSYLIMCLLRRWKVFSVIGVSVAGGVAHNVGQLLAATLILENIRIVQYLPLLLVCGTVTGMLIGILAKQLIHGIRNMDDQEHS